MLIRSAHMDDAPSIWDIIGLAIRARETYTLDRDMNEADALACGPGTESSAPTRAVALWESLGFEIVDCLPQAFYNL